MGCLDTSDAEHQSSSKNKSPMQMGKEGLCAQCRRVTELLYTTYFSMGHLDMF